MEILPYVFSQFSFEGRHYHLQGPSPDRLAYSSPLFCDHPEAKPVRSDIVSVTRSLGEAARAGPGQEQLGKG